LTADRLDKAFNTLSQLTFVPKCNASNDAMQSLVENFPMLHKSLKINTFNVVMAMSKIAMTLNGLCLRDQRILYD